MRILVTGGAGYVGSHTARRLAAAGYDVWVYDNLSRGHRTAAPAGRLIEGQLADGAGLVRLMQAKRFDVVVHFAAFAYVSESVTRPGLYYTNNVRGSLILLEAMRAAGVRKIVFSSSTAVYGEPEKTPISEDQNLRPVNPYGFGKMVIERALDDYAAAYGFGHVSLRYFNAAGASPEGDLGEDHDPETHLIPIALKVAQGKIPRVTVFGDDYPTHDGTCIRDYVHVEDLAAAHLLALEHIKEGMALKVNLGTGRGSSVRQVIDTCQEVAGRSVPTSVGDRRPGDPTTLIADPRRARAILGWEPVYPDLRTIIESAWRWHAAHPDGFRGSKARQVET